jgi:hypothetical protein
MMCQKLLMFMLHMVKTVPVNYALRFSGPVTPSPPAVIGMVLESFNLLAPVLC